MVLSLITFLILNIFIPYGFGWVIASLILLVLGFIEILIEGNSAFSDSNSFLKVLTVLGFILVIINTYLVLTIFR
jgi:hypothetical protein